MTLKQQYPLSGFLRSVFSWLQRLVSRKSSSKEASNTNPDMARLITMLRSEEGVRNEPYKDHLGYLTIGVGHLMDGRKGGSLPDWAKEELSSLGKLSDASINRLLTEDILRTVNALPEWMKYLDPVRYGVMVDMAFQMGVNGLLGFHNTLAHLQAGRYRQAANNMKQSLWYRQTPNRASRRIKEMETGEYHKYV